MTKKILACVGKYKKETFMSMIFAALEVLLEIIVPFLQSYLIDNGIYAENKNVLYKSGTVMIICVIVALIFGIIAGKAASVAASGLSLNVRRKMYYNIQDFSFGNIDKFSASSLVTRLTTDVTNVQNAYMMLIRSAIRAPLMIIFALIMAFTINTRLAFLYLIMIPILGGLLAAIIRISNPYFKKVFKEYDNLNRVVREDVSGIRAVKAFVREDYEKEKFGKVSKALYTIFKKAEGIMAYSAPVMQFIVYIVMLFIYWIGARVIVTTQNTDLTTGELTSLIAYAMQIMTSLMMLSVVLILLTIAKSSGERIDEVLDEKSTITAPENAVKTVSNGSIRFEHVYFNYGKRENGYDLTDINLNIPSGSTVGIIGATGSGKSSLVQLIPRLYDVTKGNVFVGGKNVREYDLDTLRDSVAMVLQKNVLFSGTIKENLRWGDENADDNALIHACRLAQADEFITQFPNGYDTYIEQGGTNVSGGQKQRLCIARALLKKPKILILDDSTSAVDTKTDALIRKAFREEIPDTTKIIIAQRISSVEDSDMIIVLDEGKINAVGTHEKLLKTNEIYRDIYLSQQKGGSENEA